MSKSDNSSSEQFNELFRPYLEPDNPLLTAQQKEDVKKFLIQIEEARARHIIFLSKFNAIPQASLSQGHFSLAVFGNLSLFGMLVAGTPSYALRVSAFNVNKQIQEEGKHLDGLKPESEDEANIVAEDNARLLNSTHTKAPWLNITQDPGYTVDSTNKFLLWEKAAILLSVPLILCNFAGGAHSILSNHLVQGHLATIAASWAMTIGPAFIITLAAITAYQQYKHYKTMAGARQQEFDRLMATDFSDAEILKALNDQSGEIDDETKDLLSELRSCTSKRGRRRLLNQLGKKPAYQDKLQYWNWIRYEIFMHKCLSSFGTVATLATLSISLVNILIHWNVITVASLAFPYIPAAIVGLAFLLTVGFLTYKAVSAYIGWQKAAKASIEAKQGLDEIVLALIEQFDAQTRAVFKKNRLAAELKAAIEAQERAWTPVRSMLAITVPLLSVIPLLVAGSLFLTVAAPPMWFVAIPAALALITTVLLVAGLKNWMDKRHVTKEKQRLFNEAALELDSLVVPDGGLDKSKKMERSAPPIPKVTEGVEAANNDLYSTSGDTTRHSFKAARARSLSGNGNVTPPPAYQDVMSGNGVTAAPVDLMAAQQEALRLQAEAIRLQQEALRLQQQAVRQTDMRM